MLPVPPALLRLISRLLLVVLLGTVAAPGFGWEALGGNPPLAKETGRSTAAVDDTDCHGHAGHADASSVGAGSEAEATLARGGEAAHHCCPGHVLGHLLGGVGQALVPAVIPAGGPLIDRAARHFSSRIPDGLERPPRPAA